MIARWLTALSFVSFCLLSLTILHMTKRPLCIDSRVVERVDRLAPRGTETVFRCAVNRATPYNTYFAENLRSLNTRIAAIERLLESMEPFYRRVQVTILPDRPYAFRVQGHQVFIGEKLFEAPGHLEKALAKIWFRERNQTLFAQQELMEEVLTDFLVFLEQGDLDIGDPDTLTTTAVRKVRWPYVIKSVEAYCDSPWKLSEHFAACRQKEESASALGNIVVETSLRPLLVHSWVQAYLSLSGAERFQFINNIPLFLRSEHTEPLPMITGLAGVGGQTSLLKAAESIRNISAFISTSKTLKESAAHRVFVANMTNELQRNGFQEAFAEATFDLLYVSKQKLGNGDLILKHLQELAKENGKIQMAVRDGEHLWMLPSKYPIPLKSFGQIKATRTVVEKCGGYNFSYVMDYADLTEKLLVVDHCDLKKPIVFGKYLKEGAEGFGTENKGVAFVQFHLPSLLMKKAELESVANVFDFIQKRDVDSPSFRSLGWREVHWSEQANAYQPHGHVDAIEWFRTPTVQ